MARRVAAVGAIGALTVLGNLRSQASEVGPGAAPRPAANAVLAPEPVAARFTGRPARVERGAADDDTQLVPAIYAWDKDVRFVYFRHMSKWM